MMKKLLAMLVAAALLLGTAGVMAQEATDPVLATVGDENVLLSEVEGVLPHLANYMEEGNDYRQAIDFVIQQRLLEKKIAEMGLDTFTEEEEASFTAEAQAQWDAGIESYVSYYLSEDTEEARATLKDQAQDYYNEQGFSQETLKENLRQRAALDRLTEQLVGDYEPTEEEVEATFQQFGESYELNYKDNIMAYEYNTIYNQQPSWYTPEGYRGIIHILLQPEAALMDNYARLVAAFEEQQSQQGSEDTQPEAEQPEAAQPEGEQAETTEQEKPESVTQEMVDAARQAILDSMKAEIDSIYATLEGGESFEDVIARLGQDPGMQVPENLANGYMVHRDSVVWDPAFTRAAFSDKMQQVGDVSDPVVGTNGIHILKYHRDVPSGLLMTDQIRADIVDYLRAVKENEVYTNALNTWRDEANVVYNEEAILAAQSAAVQQLQEVPQDAPEAVDTEGEAVPSEEAVETEVEPAPAEDAVETAAP